MDTSIYTKPEDIIEFLITKKPKIIGIDGKDGTGKSTLAKELSNKLSYKIICLDNYINKKQGGYFKFINLQDLKNEINLNKNNLLIIEGVMVLKIIQALNISLDFFIYTTDGIWLYDWSQEFDGKYSNMSLEEIIIEEEKLVNRVGKAMDSQAKEYKMEGFRKEIFEYTFKYKPWEKANIVYKFE